MALIPVLERHFHRLAIDDTRRGAFDESALRGGNRSLAVNRVAQRIDHAADHALADGDGEQFARRPHFHALGDLQVFAEDDDRDGVLFEELSARPHHAGLWEVHEFTGHDFRQTVAAGDAVADFEHLPDEHGVSTFGVEIVGCCPTRTLTISLAVCLVAITGALCP